jgi:hypothetical protein
MRGKPKPSLLNFTATLRSHTPKVTMLILGFMLTSSYLLPKTFFLTWSKPTATGLLVRVGRKTRLPLQFGQTDFICSVQAAQNVHSYEQM